MADNNTRSSTMAEGPCKWWHNVLVSIETRGPSSG